MMALKKYLKALSFGPRAMWGKNIVPQYFVFFITHRCVCFCDHCFDWVRRSEEAYAQELSLDEIEKISASMDDIMFMFLTGGEPYIREDWSEIAEIFRRNNNVQKFQSPTNGWYTDRIVTRLEESASRNPDTHYGIGVSIDAIGEDHDLSRKRPGLFERAVETLREVRKLSKRLPNVGVNAVTCISKNNEKAVAETYRYLTEEVGIKTVFFTTVRGEPRSGACRDVNIDLYESFCTLTEEDMLRDPSMGIGGFPFARLVNWKNIRKQEIIVDILRNNHWVIPCVAGRAYGILYANGDVFPCEMLDRCFGNLRDHDYDFKKVWLAPENQRWVREEILQNRCYCTHECAMSASLLFNPLELGRITAHGISEEMKFKVQPKRCVRQIPSVDEERK